MQPGQRESKGSCFSLSSFQCEIVGRNRQEELESHSVAASGLHPADGSDCRRIPMRVCMVAYTFYEFDNRVMRYAETLAERGDHVDVIALRREGQASGDVIRKVNIFRIQKRTVNEKGRISYLLKILLFFFKSMGFLAWKHARRRYHLIHVHSVPDFLVFAAWLPKLMGAKIILDIHDLLPEFYASKFAQKQDSVAFKLLAGVERISAALSDHVIVANHLWREKLLSRSVQDEKSTALINFPEQAMFYPGPKRRPDGRFLLLFPGTLNWHQGVDIAIRAFALVKEQAPHVEFHIYGEGPAEQSLVQLVTELGLQDKVLFKGLLPVTEVVTVMQKADLGVVPKRADSFGNEAFSTKILEFMCVGVPVVISETKVDRYYFNESVVKFFKPGDEHDLAHSVLLLIQGKEFREQLARNASEFVTQYAWSQNKALYLDIVERLCNPSLYADQHSKRVSQQKQ